MSFRLFNIIWLLYRCYRESYTSVSLTKMMLNTGIDIDRYNISDVKAPYKHRFYCKNWCILIQWTSFLYESSVYSSFTHQFTLTRWCYLYLFTLFFHSVCDVIFIYNHFSTIFIFAPTLYQKCQNSYDLTSLTNLTKTRLPLLKNQVYTSISKNKLTTLSLWVKHVWPK